MVEYDHSGKRTYFCVSDCFTLATLKVIKYNNDIDKFYTFRRTNFKYRHKSLVAMHNCIQ